MKKNVNLDEKKRNKKNIKEKIFLYRVQQFFLRNPYRLINIQNIIWKLIKSVDGKYMQFL